MNTISPATLARLYWCMRLGIACIWLWTALVSWCLLDLAMGIASCLVGRAWLWWAQGVLVLGYTVVIAVRMPEFLVHPFGPLSKNIAVLLCLWMLALADRRTTRA